jgi:tetratricopeptide (TPR) repeat protein
VLKPLFHSPDFGSLEVRSQGRSQMKKKPPAKVKNSSSKLHKKGVLTKSTGRVLQMAQKTTPKKSVVDDPRFAQAVQNYEAGLRAMQEHKFDKAKSYLQKVVAGPSKELADRAGVHLSTCNQHSERAANQFKSPEEHYDYAISLMNVGDYVSAREHLEKLSKQVPKADYVAYGLAALDCLTGHVEDALRHLDEAIRMNPALRFQARNDSDFQNLGEDPRFTELLYPDPGAESPSSTAGPEDR